MAPPLLICPPGDLAAPGEQEPRLTLHVPVDQRAWGSCCSSAAGLSPLLRALSAYLLTLRSLASVGYRASASEVTLDSSRTTRLMRVSTKGPLPCPLCLRCYQGTYVWPTCFRLPRGVDTVPVPIACAPQCTRTRSHTHTHMHQYEWKTVGLQNAHTLRVSYRETLSGTQSCT